MTRGLYKQPGGKLVGVTVRLSHADSDCTDSDYADSDYIDSAHTNAVKTVPYAGPAASSTVIECHIDGDFFLDGDDAGTRNLLHSMECALEQCAARCLSGSMVSERDVTAAVERTMLHHPDVRIVGMGARGIAIAFQRAIDGIDGTVGIAGIDGNDVTKVEPRDDLRIRRHTSPMETAETAEIAKNIENAGTAESDENAGTVGTGEIAETGNWAEYARRWHALKPNIVHDDPRKPQEQMDLDVEWARTAQDEGFHIVRRCTGGGAMFIEPGNTITYSLYAPLDFAHGMSVEESYELCDYWLVEALRALGLNVRFAGLNDIATQYGKLGGAAQRRFAPTHGGPGAILHHVTLAYDIDAEKMTRVLNISREKMSDKAVKSAAKHVDPMRSQTGMGRDEVVARLVDAAVRVTM